ncbi:MAG TPA: erythromycin esterase family protein [Thermoanaerobaculia bacterium]|nr:erythromycin esterase family protein [Thermoanaerobaculia bacterium]
MRRLVVVLALLVTLPSTFAAKHRAVSKPPSEEGLSAEAWLKAHAIPFATTEPGSGVDDLRVLSPLIGNARIVSLGEATHASHEFFAMKHRMLEYLVREKGFTVFSMEATLADCDRINDYVQTGNGDPAALLHELGYWVWSTDEVLALIRWMRAYNETRGDKPALSFRGFDEQIATVAAQQLDAYLHRVDSANATSTMQLYDCMKLYQANPGGYSKLPLATKDQCRANLTQLHDTVAARREAYIAASSAAEYERMLRYARTIVQTEETNAERTDENVRDRFMAENIAWIANTEHAGEKVVVWAHNGHVAAELDYQMGSYLRREYFPGSQMVIFGFAFGHGAFHAYDIAAQRNTVFTVVSPEDGHEAFFRTAALPLMFVDLRNASSRAARELFDNTSKTMWEIGAGFDAAHPEVFRPTQILSRNYDVLIWIESVAPTHLR